MSDDVIMKIKRWWSTTTIVAVDHEPRSRMDAARCKHQTITMDSGGHGITLSCGRHGQWRGRSTTLDVCQLCPEWESRQGGE